MQNTIDASLIESQIYDLQSTMDNLKHKGEIVLAIQEIRELGNTKAFISNTNIRTWGKCWAVTILLGARTYARITDANRIEFVHVDAKHLRLVDELVSYYSDEQLVEEFKKRAKYFE